jgi:hypothetical protein
MDILSLISDVGFPVAVTFFLLYRIEEKLDQIIHSIEKLPERIGKWG